MAPVTTRSMARTDENYVFDRFTPKKRSRSSLKSKLEEAKRQKQLLEQNKEEVCSLITHEPRLSSPTFLLFPHYYLQEPTELGNTGP